MSDEVQDDENKEGGVDEAAFDELDDADDLEGDDVDDVDVGYLEDGEEKEEI